MVSLSAVWLDQNERTIVPFCSDEAETKVHYYEEPKIVGYVTCNGSGCLLCRVGSRANLWAMLPIQYPVTQSIEVLWTSPSSRPDALRPELLSILQSGLQVAIAINKLDKVCFMVTAIALRDDMDDGDYTIRDFLDRWRNGQIHLALVFPGLENSGLATVPAIATILTFMGVARAYRIPATLIDCDRHLSSIVED